jgi:hypothetical protein
MALSEEGIGDLGQGETKRMTLSQYSIIGFWGARPEEPALLAARFNQLIDRLASIDPIFGNWIWRGSNRRPVQFSTIQHDLVAQIADSCARDDFRRPNPALGYSFGILNSLEGNPRSIKVTIRAGCRVSDTLYSNMAIIETQWHMEPDPAIVTYASFKAVLLALCECFDVTFCSAFPVDVMDLWDSDHYFRFGWLNYVSQRYALRVTPPQSAIVEYRPNGALFMAATDQTFVTSNPQHMAVARDIEAALAPLNALPWPLKQ